MTAVEPAPDTDAGTDAGAEASTMADGPDRAAVDPDDALARLWARLARVACTLIFPYAFSFTNRAAFGSYR